MKTCAILLPLLLLTYVTSLPLDTPFDEWRRHYGVTYATTAEHLHRAALYEATQAYLTTTLERMSKGFPDGPPFTLGMTLFADRSQEELRARSMPLLKGTPPFDMPCDVGGGRGSPPLPTTVFNASEVASLPPSFDWRSTNPHVLVPVQIQGTVGTCYAFSALETLAGAVALSTGHPATMLSVEQIIDCSPAYDCGVFGGWPCRVLQHTMKTGVMTASEYPYCVGTGACYPCPPPGYNTTFCGPPPTYCNATQFPCRYSPSKATTSAKGWRRLSTDVDQLRATLVHQGPISVLINGEFLSYYDGGVWSPPDCSADGLDHAVLLVGYGEEKDIFGTYPYWIVQNSWGGSWGDEGFFKMKRGSDTCGVESAAVNAVV